MADFEVDPQTLKLAEKGINEAIDEMQKLGIAGLAESGRGFTELELSGMDAGHGQLSAVFGEFCERWSWGVRSLVQQGSAVAERLGLAAGFYHEQEQYVDGLLKGTVSAAMGNPHQSGEQAAGKSWNEIWGDNPYTQLTNPDFSAASAAQSGENIKNAWKDAAKSKLEQPQAVTGFIQGAVTGQTP
ncbi:hypothetical protein ACWGB8_11715 [Kitasatospora sp. NPDC054939]